MGPRKRGGPRDARTSGGLDESPKEAPAVTDDTRSVNPHPLSSRGLFVPLDVNYADDPKMIEAGAEAELVYVRSLAIAKRIGSDGAIHRAHLPRLCDGIFAVVMGEDTPEDLAARLVKVGAWIEVPDGWVIASWDKWNLTADEIQSRRSGRQKGAAIGNHRRWHEARGEFDPTCVYCAESLSDRSSESLSIGIETGSESTKTETETETELAPAERPRDLIFDALVEVCAIDASQLTSSARGALNKARKELVALGASDEDVRRKADAYRAAYPGISLTPSALVKHWPALGSPTTIKPKPKPSGPESVLRERPDGTLERFYPGTGWVSAAG